MWIQADCVIAQRGGFNFRCHGDTFAHFVQRNSTYKKSVQLFLLLEIWKYKSNTLTRTKKIQKLSNYPYSFMHLPRAGRTALSSACACDKWGILTHARSPCTAHRWCVHTARARSTHRGCSRWSTWACSRRFPAALCFVATGVWGVREIYRIWIPFKSKICWVDFLRRAQIM